MKKAISTISTWYCRWIILRLELFYVVAVAEVSYRLFDEPKGQLSTNQWVTWSRDAPLNNVMTRANWNSCKVIYRRLVILKTIMIKDWRIQFVCSIALWVSLYSTRLIFDPRDQRILLVITWWSSEFWIHSQVYNRRVNNKTMKAYEK